MLIFFFFWYFKLRVKYTNCLICAIVLVVFVFFACYQIVASLVSHKRCAVAGWRNLAQASDSFVSVAIYLVVETIQMLTLAKKIQNYYIPEQFDLKAVFKLLLDDARVLQFKIQIKTCTAF